MNRTSLLHLLGGRWQPQPRPIAALFSRMSGRILHGFLGAKVLSILSMNTTSWLSASVTSPRALLSSSRVTGSDSVTDPTAFISRLILARVTVPLSKRQYEWTYLFLWLLLVWMAECILSNCFLRPVSAILCLNSFSSLNRIVVKSSPPTIHFARPNPSRSLLNASMAIKPIMLRSIQTISIAIAPTSSAYSLGGSSK